MEVEMKIRGLMMDPVTQMPIVVLKDVQGQSVLPIWVGAYEANAIALEIEKVSTPRPMTHDLLKNVLLGLDVHVQKIVVNDLRDDTFFALIWVERAGEEVTVLGEDNGRIVAVRQGALLATAFHPELTPDTRIHELFVKMVKGTS